jgi:hypothetical protein
MRGAVHAVVEKHHIRLKNPAGEGHGVSAINQLTIFFRSAKAEL